MTSQSQTFCKVFTENSYPLDHHRLGGSAIFPASAYLEMARAFVADAVEGAGQGAAHAAVELHAIRFEQAFVVVGQAELCVTSTQQGGELEIRFSTREARGELVVLATMRGRAVQFDEGPHWSVESCAGASVGVYEAFKLAGMDYGADFRTLTSVSLGDGGGAGLLQLPDRLAATASDFGLHPSLLDGAMQLCALAHLMGEGDGRMLLPTRVERLSFRGPAIEHGAGVEVRVATQGRQGFDLRVRNPDGALCLLIEGLQGSASRRAARPAAVAPVVLVPGLLAEGAPVARPPAGATVVCAPASLLAALDAGWRAAGGEVHGRLSLDDDPGAGRSLAGLGDGEAMADHLHQREAFRVAIVPDDRFAQTEASTRELFDVLQRWLAIRVEAPTQLVLGACLAPGRFDGALLQRRARLHALAMLLRTVAVEQQSFSAAVVLQDEPAGPLLFERMAREAASCNGFVLARYAGGRRLVHGITDESPPEAAATPVDKSHVVLVSGGAGAIGCHLARGLAERGFRQVALIGRAPRGAAEDALRRAGLTLGDSLLYSQADLGDAAQTANAVEHIVRQQGAIGQVLHAAGALRDGLFQDKPWSDFAEVTRGKIGGALHLDAATCGQPISRFVLFSSISSLFGNAGQSDYAYANAFLDEFAQARNEAVARGLRQGRTTSINWGLWRDGGMHVPPSVERWLREATGLVPMATDTALAGLDEVLAQGTPRALIGAGDRVLIRHYFGPHSVQAMAPADAPLPPPPSTTPPPQSSPQTGSDWQAATRALLLRLVAQALKADAGNLHAGSSLESLGFDSFLVIQTSRQLEPYAGRVAKSIFYDARTLGDLGTLLIRDYGDALSRSLASDPVAAAASAPQPVDAEASAPGPVAHDPMPAPARAPARAAAPAATTGLVGTVRTLRDAAPAFGPWLDARLRTWGDESAHAAATADIAPHLFASACSGTFLFNCAARTWFAFAYVGPDDAFGPTLQALQAHAAVHSVSLQLLLSDPWASRARALGYSTTRFGVLQRLPALSDFTLAGTRMRRLRYLVEKVARHESVELLELPAPLPDGVRDEVLALVDLWCAGKTGVSPYVARIRAELAAGTLHGRHRVFGTRLDGALINVIVVTALPRQAGCLMDLEFYGRDMVLGGLDWSIARLIEHLRAEGVDFFSLGATFGTQYGEDPGTDAAVLATLQELHARGALNNDGNHQFKSKFRPVDEPIFLCASPGAPPSSLEDALLLFGDPTAGLAPHGAADAETWQRWLGASPPGATTAASGRGCPRFDVRSDSWNKLEADFISEHMLRLQADNAAVPSLEEAAARVFPYRHVFGSAQGRRAEALLYKALAATSPAGRRQVAQNVLFPTQVYHQLDNGFVPVELVPAAKDGGGAALFVDAPDPGRLRDLSPTLAAVVLELCPNQSGGRPLSLAALRSVSQACRRLDVPLFLDATRLIDNALLISYHEPAERGRATDEIVREICALADGLTTSLAKNFSITEGALLACNDDRLAAEVERLLRMEGDGLSRRQSALMARGLMRLDETCQRVHERLRQVDRLAQQLAAAGIAVWRPAGAHAVVIDAGAMAPWMSQAEPAVAYAAWLECTAGVQVAPHLGSSVDRSGTKRLVRLAVPVGLPQAQAEQVAQAICAAHGVAPAQPPHVADEEARPEDIAIVGMAFRCAGADDVDAFWDLLRAGRDVVTEVPAARWDHRLEKDRQGRPVGRWGAFMQDVDMFDSLFFRISPREAELMDPQERLFLEAAWTAMEEAGYAPQELQRTVGGRVGVFVGAVWSLYHTIGHEQVLKGRLVAPNSFHWSIANRVSFVMDLRGPSMAVDTACSSSLTALHLACESLARGECDMAVVGGVNLDLHPSKPRVTNVGNVLSVRGRCAAFGADADGYVPGEGVGAIVVKPLRLARRDGDHVHAVVRGTQVSHAGRTNGYAVPSPSAQAALVSATLARAGVRAGDIGCIEAHGTGTSLGDPIEVAGLSEAFRTHTTDRQFCALGSVKSNIGHLEAAAGIAGLVKAVLQLRQGLLVPTLHARDPNPAIEFEATPFYLVHEPVPWAQLRANGRAKPRRAGVSSFGAGGANAHAILQEAPALPQQPQRSCRPELVPLSARSPQQLSQAARDLLHWLESPAAAGACLGDIAFTLTVGRVALDCRLAIVAASVEELCRGLRAALAGDASKGGWYQGRRGAANPPGTDDGGAVSATPGLQAEARRWVDGDDVDGQTRFERQPARRLSLPTQRFERVRHWVVPESEVAGASAPAPASLHPLLHAVDAADPFLYRVRLAATHFVITDHRVAGHPTLPGVAYIEMARAAVGHHLGRPDAPLRLTAVTWLQPIMLAEGAVDVLIRLAPNATQVSVTVSTVDPASGAARVHAQCKVHVDGGPEPAPRVDLAALLALLTANKDRALIYATLRAMGMEHGGSFQTLQSLRHDGTQGIAVQSLPDVRRADPQAGAYRLHPSLMDGALQAAAVLVKRLEEGTGSPDIPFVIRSVDHWRAPPADCIVHVVLDPQSTQNVRRFDIDILDTDGTVCVRMRGFSVRPFKGVPAVVARPLQTAGELLFYVDESQAVSLPPPGPLAAPVLLLHDGDTAPPISALPKGSVVVTIGRRWDELDAHRCVIDGARPQDVDLLVQWLESQGHAACRDHVHYDIDGSSATTPYEHVRRLERLLRVLPTPAAGTLRRVAISHSDERPDIACLAAAWRCVLTETRSVCAIAVALDAPSASAPAGERLRAVHALGWPAQEGAVAEWRIERGMPHRTVRRLRPLESVASSGSAFGQHRSFLVTGGAGGIGRLVARHLARHHGAALTLVGRRDANADIDAFVAELAALGGQAVYVRADVATDDGAQAAVAAALACHGALHGVLHAAGVSRDRLMRDKGADEFESVLAPKLRGIECLDRATSHLDLAFFVAFSSVASALGNLGQADYAAANRGLDVHCARRARRSSGRSLSLRWPLWAEGGMRPAEAAWRLVERRSGMRKLSTEQALEALDRCLDLPHPVIGVVVGDPERLRSWLGATPDEHPSVAQATTTAAPLADPTNLNYPEALAMPSPDDHALLAWVQGELTRTAARLLKLRPESLEVTRDMNDYGIDSVVLTEFTDEVNRQFDIELSPVAFFEFVTLQTLAGHLVDEFGDRLRKRMPAPVRAAAPPQHPTPAPAAMARPAPAPAQAPPPRPAVLGAGDPIAIVGLSARLPGAPTLDEFWDKLVRQEQLLSEVPADRFDWRSYVGDVQREVNRMASKWGGFITDIDKFDPLFFRLSPVEAAFMDPQQRVFLETVWHTIEDAGYRPEQLSNSRTGIFVGLATSDYMELLHTTYPQVETHMTTGNAHSVLPNRISYLLNLRGPSEPIDTACSSSLVALHRAAQSIRTGECDQAIAGGVGLMLTPTTFISFSRAGMLSPDGLCKTFDKDANGYVRGEGTAAVLLKPLARALQDGDHIYGLLRGSAVNHGGYATSLTAPNPNAQAEVIVDAYRNAGVDPDAVGYIEAHGTGTPLGDPVEITGLKKAFRALRAEQGKAPAATARCGVGSVKSAIGHLEAAAGIAGVVKVLLALKHGELPPTQHVRSLNPYIDLAGSHFYIATERTPWHSPLDAAGRALPRCAGVSSFGFGGVNAHVVIEEFVDEQAASADDAAPSAQLFVLSAKTEAALQRAVRNLADWLARRSDHAPLPALADIAYTLQVGRTAYAHRVAFVAGSHDEAALHCEQILRSEPAEGVFTARTAPSSGALQLLVRSEAGRDLLSGLMRRGELSLLGALWAEGLPLDFAAAHADAPRLRRVSLPGYAFERESYWIPYEDITAKMTLGAIHPMREAATATAPAGAPARAPTVAAPVTSSIVREATADGKVERFVRRYTEREFIFADHRLKGRPLLPAAGHLELAAAASRLARGRTPGIEFTDVVWSRPLHLSSEGDAQVALMAAANGQYWRFSVSDAQAPASRLGEDPTVYASGQLRTLDEVACRRWSDAQTSVSPMARRAQCTVEREAPQVYEGFSGIGLEYGSGFRTVLSLMGNDEESVGVVELPEGLNASFDEHCLHPALIDGALQCIDGLTVDGRFDPDRLSVPYSLERLVAVLPLPRKVLVHVALRAGGRPSGVKVVDIGIFDMAESLVARLEGFAIRALTRSDALSARTPAGSPPSPSPSPSVEQSAQQFLVALVARALKIPPARVGLDTGFDQFGIDSLSISRLSQALEESFGSLPKTLFFEHNNLRELAQYFAQHHAAALRRLAGAGASPVAGGPAPVPASAPAPVSAAGPRGEPVAEAIDWHREAQQMLVTLVSEALKLPRARVDLDASFDQYGIDSLSISRLTERLEARFGSLPKTLFFEYNNLRQLAAHLAGRHRDALARLQPSTAGAAATVPNARPRPEPVPEPIAEPQPEPEPEAAPGAHADDIAIVGIAGRYPQADDLDTYWAHLRDGRDCVEPVPAERWDARWLGNASTPRRHGGFIRDVDRFDNLFFGISPREARTLDPNERLFLEVAWSAVEDAGYRPEFLGRVDGDEAAGNAVGVFVGVMWGQYANLGVEAWAQGRHQLLTSTHWSIANRVSYAMDFQGPSMAVDTACSSSLSALHMACECLRRGDCRAALAGGVNLNVHPIKYADLGKAGFLSSDGRCRSFGEGGDGYVPGEGVGVAVLKRLRDALRDGDHVHGVIKAGAINHGGRTTGFAMPNPVAQGRAIRAAIERAGVPADSIGYVEAHGTGTLFGDAIEMAGLARGFGRPASAHGRCLVGSVKSNIGHLEAASGIAALSKVLLQMRHGQIAPSLHSERLNPDMALEGGPFQVVQTLTDWPRLRVQGLLSPRRAGISSFGAGGANAHLVVEEFIDPREAAAVPSLFGTELVVLSGRDQQALREAAQALLRHLENAEAVAPVDRIAHTLQTGRRHCECRLALLAGDLDSLRSGLRRFLESGADGIAIFTGEVDEGAGDADPRTLVELARAWTQGSPLDWSRYRVAGAARRCPLPTYPFQRKRFWAEGMPDRLYEPMAPDRAVAATPAESPPDAASAAERARHMLLAVAAEHPGATITTCRPSWVLDDGAAEADITSADRWLMLCDDPDLVAHCRAALLSQGIGGDRLVVARAGDAFEAREDGYVVAPGDPDHAARLLRAMTERGGPPTCLLNAWNWPAQARLRDCSEADQLREVASLKVRGIDTMFAYARAWQEAGLAKGSVLLHAHAVQQEGGSPTEAGVLGLARSLARENPAFRVRLVELEAGEDAGLQAEQLIFESLLRREQPCAVRYRGGRREVQVLAVCAVPDAQAAVAAGTYLITGGLGGLGRLLAESLSRPDLSVVLVGRREPDAEARRWLDQMSPRFRQLAYFVADCADLGAMQEVMEQVRARFGALHGVIHAAGVVEGAPLAHRTPRRIAAVLAPKVAGTVVLDQVTRDEPLHFFLMLSSLVAAVGSQGLTDYACANAFMGGWAAHRQALTRAGRRKGVSVAIDLPLWCEGGMGVSEENIRGQVRSFGIVPMRTEAGLKVVHQAMRATDAELVVFSGHFELLQRAFDLRAEGAAPAPAACPWTTMVEQGLLAISEPSMPPPEPGRLTIHQASELAADLHRRSGQPVRAADVQQAASVEELAARLRRGADAGRSGVCGRLDRQAVEALLDRLDVGQLSEQDAQAELQGLTG